MACSHWSDVGRIGLVSVRNLGDVECTSDSFGIGECESLAATEGCRGLEGGVAVSVAVVTFEGVILLLLVCDY